MNADRKGNSLTKSDVTPRGTGSSPFRGPMEDDSEDKKFYAGKYQWLGFDLGIDNVD